MFTSRWFFKRGYGAEVKQSKDGESPTNAVEAVAGVPRWLFKDTLESTIKWVAVSFVTILPGHFNLINTLVEVVSAATHEGVEVKNHISARVAVKLGRSISYNTTVEASYCSEPTTDFLICIDVSDALLGQGGITSWHLGLCSRFKLRSKDWGSNGNGEDKNYNQLHLLFPHHHSFNWFFPPPLYAHSAQGG